MPPPSISLPPLIGHRGLAGLAPENTLPAFEAAHRAGLQMVELDAKLCGSGELIVLHDNTVERTTNGHGRAVELSYPALRRLDAGRWFGPAFAGTRIPLLCEVLDFLASRHLAVNIELKPNRGDYRQTARAVARLIADNGWGKKLDILISSFSLQSLRAARDCLPQIPRGLLLERRKTCREILALMRELDAVSLHYDAALLTPALLGALQKRGIPVLLWTVNEAATAQDLLRRGVTGVFSDFPLAIKKPV